MLKVLKTIILYYLGGRMLRNFVRSRFMRRITIQRKQKKPSAGQREVIILYHRTEYKMLYKTIVELYLFHRQTTKPLYGSDDATTVHNNNNNNDRPLQFRKKRLQKSVFFIIILFVCFVYVQYKYYWAYRILNSKYHHCTVHTHTRARAYTHTHSQR